MSLTVGDTAPALTGTCTSDGAGVNMTGATLEVHLRKPDRTTILTKAATAVDATAGTWKADAWAVDDLDQPGSWTAEMQVTFSDSTIQTFGPQSFYVNAQIA